MPYNSRTSSRRGPRSQSFGGGGGGRRSNNRRKGPQKAYIHPSKFVREARPVTQEEYISQNTFADFDVDQIIKDNITTKGFVNPSPIQDQTIPLGLEGKDIIGVANTGTGKTAAFAIPVLHRLIMDANSHALIVAPTRELAQQIEDECRELGKKTGVYGALLIGGSPMGPQLRDLRANPRIVIGTPGRIKDHVERGTLNLGKFDMVVLDEVDRMLDMGFMPDVSFILGQLASPRQSFFFSATFDHKVRQLIGDFSNDPITISVKTSDTSDNVHQDIICYGNNEDKIAQLHNLLIKDEVEKVIIFDETQRNVERLGRELQSRGFKVDDIHGGKTQGQRQRALNSFKKSEINILVATDVAARGIDVADITHVINYATPQSYEDYVHRIGRAGRAGRVGYALTFITE